MSSEMRILAVVVTYRPEQAVLFRLLDDLKCQVAAVVIVDNGSSPETVASLRARNLEHEHLLELGSNFGIATAQNRGIRLARDLGATHVVLFDHDSEPAADMVACLHQCMVRLMAQGRRVASVGPRYVDDRQDNPPPFIRVRNCRLHRCLEPENGDAVEVDYLIASGCLVDMRAFDEAGLMNEGLFIDYVDIEWGLRAKDHGWTHFGCFSAKMKHQLGDDPIEFMGVAYPARSPLRHYYMFRNAVLLYRMPHVPVGWKIVDGLRGVLRFGFYSLFAKPRHKHIQMMLTGMWHGLMGKGGQIGFLRAIKPLH